MSAPSSSGTDNPRSGILHMLVSTVLFSCMFAIAKVLADRYSVIQIAFFRSIFGFIPVIGMVVAAGGWSVLRPHQFHKHVWRAVLGMSGLTLGILSYSLMPLADAVAISFASPLIVTALSVPLLKERVGPFRWSAVVVGFVGVLVIVRPGGDMLGLGAMVALAAAFIGALVSVTLRQLNRIDNSVTIVFYFIVLSTVISALPMPFIWVRPTLHDWGLAAAMGLCGGFAQYYLTRAYGLAGASVISPFGYMSLLWSGFLGWLFWNDVPGPNVFIGAPIVVASGLAILYRETRRAKAAERKDERAV